MIATGYYKATIREGWLEASQDVNDEARLCFRVEVGGDRVVDGDREQIATAPVTGKWKDIGRKVAEHLGLDWPNGLKDLTPATGKEVRIRVKHTEKDGETYTNVYIQLGREPRPATKEQVEATIAKIELTEKVEGDDDCPF